MKTTTTKTATAKVTITKTKKAILTLILLLTASVNISAFERDSLISGKQYSHGGFGGITSKTTELNGTTENMVGIKGAWLLNHNVYVGLAGYGTNGEIENTDRQMGYGGVIAGYIFNPSKFVHYNVEMLLGAGGLDNEKNRADDPDAFSVIEPAANVSFAITPYADLSIGVSYRLVQETNQANLSDSDLSGWSMNTSLVFGRF